MPFPARTPVYYIASPASFAGNLNGKGTVHLTQNTTITGTVTFNDTTLIVDAGVTLTVNGTLSGSRMVIQGTVANRGSLTVSESITTEGSGLLNMPITSAITELPSDSFYAGLRFRMAVGARVNLRKDGATQVVTAVTTGNFTARIANAGGRVRCCFVPTETSTYTLTSTGSNDTYGHLYDASGSEIASDDDSGANTNFKITHELTANTVYFYDVRFYGSGATGSIDLVLSEESVPTEITGYTSRISAAIGATVTFRVRARGNRLSYQWEQQAPDSEAWVNATASGSQTDALSLTVAQAHDRMKFRCKVTGADGRTVYSNAGILRVIRDIRVGTSSVEIATGGEIVKLRFVPTESTTYTLTSTGSDDTYGYLYDASGNEITSNDDGGEGYNFKITYAFTANTVYYFGVKYYSSSATGTINLVLGDDSVPTAITGQPANVSAAIGATATFRVAASGNRLTYQWEQQAPGSEAWVNVTASGSQTDTLSLTVAQAHDRMKFRCKVTGADGRTVYSNAATLRIIRDIRVGTSSVEIATGGEIVKLRFVPTESTTYTLTSTGSADTYGYLYDASGNEITSNDDGGEGYNFKITYAFTANTVYYFGVKYYSSSATGTINLVLGDESVPTEITGQPASVSAAIGGTATFRVTASGSRLTYQWEQQAPGSEAWVNVSASGSQTDTLSLTVAQAHDRMKFRCKVTGADGRTVYSNEVTLQVIRDIRVGTSSVEIATGGEIVKLRFVPTESKTYTLTSTGSADTYGHLYDASGNQIASNDDGGEGYNFKITYAFTANTVYYFGVRYYNSNATGTINLVLSQESVPTEITSQPASVSAVIGATATFRVTARGERLSYQWEQQTPGSETWENATASGSRTDTLSLTVARAHDRMKFRCKVTGADGTPTYSNEATLRVVQDISLGRSSVEIMTGGEMVKLRFVPTITGSYTLTSAVDMDTVGYLYDASGNQITSDDDSGDGRNFKISRSLTAGTTYFYGVKYYNNDTIGTVTLVLSPDFNDVEITGQPVDVQVAPNATATFRVTATGSHPTYRWQQQRPGSDTWENTSLSGYNTNTLRFTATESLNRMSFRCQVTGDMGLPIYSNTVTLYVTTATTRYRALLISEVAFSPVCNRNEGDVQMMKRMLQSVKGPDGASYTITTGRDWSSSQVQNAIASTFRDATAQDVSLFFIATHGDTSYGAGSRYAGALATVHRNDYILFEQLASWLNRIPGKVIVIVESCGSGAAIYGNGDDAISDDQFSRALISAFASEDEKYMDEVAKTGELRVANKFYVLTASALQQSSWGTESDNPFNYFTKWLVDGIGYSGSFPADTRYAGNRDGKVTLEELYRYISAVGDDYPFRPGDGHTYYQTVKRYPENSNYQLFIR